MQIWRNILYFLNCKKHIFIINAKVLKTSNGRIMLLSKCATSNSKNQDLTKKKNQENY